MTTDIVFTTTSALPPPAGNAAHITFNELIVPPETPAPPEGERIKQFRAIWDKSEPHINITRNKNEETQLNRRPYIHNVTPTIASIRTVRALFSAAIDNNTSHRILTNSPILINAKHYRTLWSQSLLNTKSNRLLTGIPLIHSKTIRAIFDVSLPGHKTLFANWSKSAPFIKTAFINAANAILLTGNKETRILWDDTGKLGSRFVPILVPFLLDLTPDPEGRPPVTPKEDEYTLMNSMYIIRLSDSENVPASRVTIKATLDNYPWTINATLINQEALDLIKPAETLTDIEVTLNSHVWRFKTEKYNIQEKRIGNVYTIQGRSLSIELGKGFAPPSTYLELSPRNAQQLALAPLEYTGFTLDWQAPDWFIPGSIFSYRNLTPIEIVGRIADSIQATVTSHPWDKIIIVAPYYKISPWDWTLTQPDKIIPDYVWFTLGEQWNQQANKYDAVYCLGSEGGEVIHVRRTGSLGTSYLTDSPNSLITDYIPGRERGRQLIAKANSTGTFSIKLPLFPPETPPGLILPGDLIEIIKGLNTFKALCIDTTIDANRRQALQTLNCIAHHE